MTCIVKVASLLLPLQLNSGNKTESLKFTSLSCGLRDLEKNEDRFLSHRVQGAGVQREGGVGVPHVGQHGSAGKGHPSGRGQRCWAV